MSESKRLTGREAVIALMQGKKVKRVSVPEFVYSINNCNHFVLHRNKHYMGTHMVFHDFLTHNDWEIVPEPMVEEFEVKVLDETWGGASIEISHSFVGKRVKVRVEEILE